MKSLLGTLLLALLHFTLWSQHSSLRTEAEFKASLLREANRVRDSLHLWSLREDPVLSQAAAMQADWCKKANTLSHFQNDNRRHFDPQLRVIACGGKHDGVTENLLLNFPKEGESMDEFARRLIWQWVHSPGHFANLSDPDSRLSGFGIAVNGTKVFVCHVLARAGWQPMAGIKIHPRAWRIQPRDHQACGELDRFSGKEREFATGFDYRPGSGRKGQNQIQFHHAKADLLRQMLGYRRGAIAPDIIFRSQFPCDGPNLLHGSPYHDGYLLKPRSYRWMAKRNEPDSLRPKELRAFTHRIPTLPEQDFQTNSVITVNRHFCRYGIPVTILSGSLGPYSYELPPDTIPMIQATPFRRKHLEFVVEFDKGSSKIHPSMVKAMMDSLREPGGEVVSLRVRGYASIEGPLALNLDLMEDRAQGILSLVQSVQRSQVPMHASAAENWRDFWRDIRGTDREWMRHMSADEIRDTLLKNRGLVVALEPIHARHRYCQVDMDVRFALPGGLDQTTLVDSFWTAFASKKYALAHQLQSEMVRRWLRSELDADGLLRYRIPVGKHTLPLAYNQAWVRQRLNGGTWEVLPPAAMALTRNYPWFTAQQTLAETRLLASGVRTSISPKVVYQNIQLLKSLNAPDSLIKVLELNHYIAAARAAKAGASLDDRILEAIRVRLGGDTLSVRKVVRLGLFYNGVGGTSATIRLMKPYRKLYRDDEEFAFLFAWTSIIHPDQVPEEEWLDWMDHARTLNARRWREMVATDWQLLRWQRIKSGFCGCSA